MSTLKDKLFKHVINAFTPRELLKVGNRSWLRAFKHPSTRVDTASLDPSVEGNVKTPPLGVQVRMPSDEYTDWAIIPPASLVFKHANGLVYEKKWWGKVVGGSADAATVIQSALNGLTSGRTWKEKAVVRGDLTLSRTLDIPSYTVLEILGNLNLASGVNSHMLTLDNRKEVEVVGGILDGKKLNQTAGYGIYVKTAGVNIRFRNVKVYNTYSHGIAVENGENVNVEGCALEAIGDCGVIFSGDTQKRGSVVHSYFKDITNTGVALFYGVTKINGYHVVANNRFWNVKNAVDVFQVLMNVIANNNVKIATNLGINLDTTDENVVVGNRIDEVTNAGIQLSNVSHDNVIVGNKISASGGGIAEGASGDYNTILGNDVRGNTTPLSKVGANTTVKFNTGYITENTGTATFSGDAATVDFDIAHGLAAAPSVVKLEGKSVEASKDKYWQSHPTAPGTYFRVTFLAAPPAGTNNVVINWQAEV